MEELIDTLSCQLSPLGRWLSVVWSLVVALTVSMEVESPGAESVTGTASFQLGNVGLQDMRPLLLLKPRL